MVDQPARPARDAWQAICEMFLTGEPHDRMHQICDTMGLSPGLVRTLLQLSPDTPTPMRELGAAFGCDASYVTALIDGLEERGYAVRRPNADDRRVKTVALTAAGSRTRARILGLLHEPPSGFDALSASEQRHLRDLLRKVAAADPVLAAR